MSQLYLSLINGKTNLQGENIEDAAAVGLSMVEGENIDEVTIMLPEDKIQEYREVFSFFDRDGGGTITSVELGQVMRTFGWNPTEGDLQEMIGEIDQDGNGCISFNEFLYLMTKNVHEDGDIEEEIREAFRVFDREGHGFITVPDLTTVLTTLGDKLTEGKLIMSISIVINELS